MGRLIIAVLVIALAWMGFWVFAATMLERGIRNYVEGPQQGVQIATAAVEVDGFPNRLDTRLSDISVTLPESGTTWEAPFAELLALVYRPTEVIAALPPSHRLLTPLQTVEMTQDRARASVALQATSDLALDRATMVVESARATSSLGWEVTLAEARFSVAETDPATYRLGFEGLDIAANTTPEGVPDRIGRLHLDATAAFTHAWDRGAMNEERLPQITRLAIDAASLDWGEMSFTAEGTLEVDRSGRPEGSLDLRILNWRAALDALDAAGLIGGRVTPTLTFALQALSDGDTLEIPLGFRRGLMTLGPVPLGPAPNLAIR